MTLYQDAKREIDRLENELATFKMSDDGHHAARSAMAHAGITVAEETVTMVNELVKERDALAKFKAYVHDRLDAAGIDRHDEANAVNGCRIGARLDDLIAAAGRPTITLPQLEIVGWVECRYGRGPDWPCRCDCTVPGCECCADCGSETMGGEPVARCTGIHVVTEAPATATLSDPCKVCSGHGVLPTDIISGATCRACDGTGKAKP